MCEEMFKNIHDENRFSSVLEYVHRLTLPRSHPDKMGQVHTVTNAHERPRDKIIMSTHFTNTHERPRDKIIVSTHFTNTQ